jgi:hypothetical protein
MGIQGGKLMTKRKMKAILNVENMNELTLLTKRVERALKELRVATKELDKFKLKMSMETEDSE